MQRHEQNLPDKDLAYFSEGSAWAQDYALLNRCEMMRLVLEVLERELSSRINAWNVVGEAINFVERETRLIDGRNSSYPVPN